MYRPPSLPVPRNRYKSTRRRSRCPRSRRTASMCRSVCNAWTRGHHVVCSRERARPQVSSVLLFRLHLFRNALFQLYCPRSDASGHWGSDSLSLPVLLSNRCAETSRSLTMRTVRAGGLLSSKCWLGSRDRFSPTRCPPSAYLSCLCQGPKARACK